MNGLRGAEQRELHCGRVQLSIKNDLQCADRDMEERDEFVLSSLEIQQFTA